MAMWCRVRILSSLRRSSLSMTCRFSSSPLSEGDGPNPDPNPNPNQQQYNPSRNPTPNQHQQHQQNPYPNPNPTPIQHQQHQQNPYPNPNPNPAPNQQQYPGQAQQYGARRHQYRQEEDRQVQLVASLILQHVKTPTSGTPPPPAPPSETTTTSPAGSPVPPVSWQDTLRSSNLPFQNPAFVNAVLKQLRGHPPAALAFFRWVGNPNAFTYTTLITSFAKARLVDQALQLFQEMRALPGCTPTTATYNAVIDGLSKTGRVEEALKLLREMPKHGCPPNKVTFCVIVDGLVKVNRMEEAIDMLEEMDDALGVPPLPPDQDPVLRAAQSQQNSEDLLPHSKQ